MALSRVVLVALVAIFLIGFVAEEVSAQWYGGVSILI
jgi:hypothetical protein